MTVYTCTGINAGEELCVRYIDIRGAYSYRQYMLQERKGFSEANGSQWTPWKQSSDFEIVRLVAILEISWDGVTSQYFTILYLCGPDLLISSPFPVLSLVVSPGEVRLPLLLRGMSAWHGWVKRLEVSWRWHMPSYFSGLKWYEAIRHMLHCDPLICRNLNIQI